MRTKAEYSEQLKNQIAELGYAAGYTASEKGKPQLFMPGRGEVPFGPGAFIPNSTYCNDIEIRKKIVKKLAGMGSK